MRALMCKRAGGFLDRRCGATLFAAAWVTAPAFARTQSTIITEDQAFDRVMKAVKKYNLTTLKEDCLMFVMNDETALTYDIDVRELHNEKCGGDPEVGPVPVFF